MSSTEFKLVEGYPKKVEQRVQELLRTGWQLHGGLCVTRLETGGASGAEAIEPAVVMQAMTREDQQAAK